MAWPTWIRKQQGKYWLIFGAVSFLGASLSSIVRSLDGTFGDIAYLSLDWFAACVIYFFLGGMCGHVLDWWLQGKKKTVHPLWLWLTITLWVVSGAVVGVFARDGLLNPWLILFFPFAFGIFFTGSAFTLIAPSFVQTTVYGKLLLDIIYLAVFGAWLYFTVYMKKHVTITRVLLLLLFAVLFLGIAGCVKFLS